MIVINLIDKDRVQGHEDFGDARAVWRARLFLFIGFALMAGGLAGSVVSTSSFFCLLPGLANRSLARLQFPVRKPGTNAGSTGAAPAPHEGCAQLAGSSSMTTLVWTGTSFLCLHPSGSTLFVEMLTCTILQTVLVLKYILHHYTEQFTYYGYANVSQNVALMLSAIVLWISQSVSTEYEYTLSI